MNTIQFKTSINCGSCVRMITPTLDAIEHINWSVDTAHPDKVLTVKTDTIEATQIINAVSSAGFEIEQI